MSAVAPGVHFESYIIKEVKGITYGIILKSEKVKVLKPRGNLTPYTFSSLFQVSLNIKKNIKMLFRNKHNNVRKHRTQVHTRSIMHLLVEPVQNKLAGNLFLFTIFFRFAIY